ncbi:cell division protein SepF [Pseudoclavibacter endophyticus]|uniref:Cell division protein SepF n=1 Tax=Pseudoclavibacter endophyticus TaxID=1778590 RepID=A0A6H9WMZ2_9MICO|nr:cell division protein SepF [Pseudoclavibacter endophyticus]KAB1650246.1 DUF552 domain-containing protein [Pseudoclavibacter endophyticus]GGA55863.1 cell division protein SepF [Pseudoclavibacter endophyticus]
MANPLRNAMVYLGLAEEDDEQYEAPRQAPPAAATRTERTERASRQEPYVRSERHEAVDEQPPAPVTPINPNASKPVQNPVASEMNEILTVNPKAYKDAQVIAEHFRDGVPVIINLSQMEDAEARRLIDFASGLSQGLYGKIERVTNRVFLLSPHHVAVHTEQQRDGAAKEASFFA